MGYRIVSVFALAASSGCSMIERVDTALDRLGTANERLVEANQRIAAADAKIAVATQKLDDVQARLDETNRQIVLTNGNLARPVAGIDATNQILRRTNGTRSFGHHLHERIWGYGVSNRVEEKVQNRSEFTSPRLGRVAQFSPNSPIAASHRPRFQPGFLA
jgi:hypothetical protein